LNVILVFFNSACENGLECRDYRFSGW